MAGSGRLVLRNGGRWTLKNTRTLSSKTRGRWEVEINVIFITVSSRVQHIMDSNTGGSISTRYLDKSFSQLYNTLKMYILDDL